MYDPNARAGQRLAPFAAFDRLFGVRPPARFLARLAGTPERTAEFWTACVRVAKQQERGR